MEPTESLVAECKKLSLEPQTTEDVTQACSSSSQRKMMVSNEEMLRIMKKLNDFTTYELKEILINEKLSILGKKKDLRDRVKNFYKKYLKLYEKERIQARPRRNRSKQHFKYLVVVDFECTCRETNFDFPHEIIQFPAVLVDVKSLTIIDTFDSFVKPTINPILDKFCTSLCGITQDDVDTAPSFEAVLTRFYKWLDKYDIRDGKEHFAFVTDGYQDFWKFFQFKFYSLGEYMPYLFRNYINMRRSFEYKVKTIPRGIGKTGVQSMLEHYDLEFDGQIHNGLDDARNIARICIEMMYNNVEFLINESLVDKRDALPVLQRSNSPHEKQPVSDFSIWRNKLPLVIRRVSKAEFLAKQHLNRRRYDEEFDENE